MPTMRPLLLSPLIGGSLAFACGGDARPAASADSMSRPAVTSTASAPKQNCPDAAEISRVLGHTVAPLRSGVGCQYVSDDESYDADLIFGSPATGTRLMGEVREEAESRHRPTEAPGFGDQGILWAGLGNATGVVIGNGKAAYAAVSMAGKDSSVTRAAVLTFLRQGIQ
jgi:hypothetical protein